MLYKRPDDFCCASSLKVRRWTLWWSNGAVRRGESAAHDFPIIHTFCQEGADLRIDVESVGSIAASQRQYEDSGVRSKQINTSELGRRTTSRRHTIAGILETKAMVTVSAHFDGKVIVPDEPLELPQNQPLIVSIERAGGGDAVGEESVLTWLASNAVENDTLPVDLADQHDHYLYGRSTKDK